MITVPRKVVPIVAPPRQEDRPAPAEKLLTRADVESMLAARDAMWREQLAALESAFASAIAALPKPRPAPTWDFKIETDSRGNPTGMKATPK